MQPHVILNYIKNQFKLGRWMSNCQILERVEKLEIRFSAYKFRWKNLISHFSVCFTDYQKFCLSHTDVDVND